MKKSFSDYFKSKKRRYTELVARILDYYVQHPEQVDPDIEEALEYLKSKGSFRSFPVFPYNFSDLKVEDTEVLVDKDSGMYYVIHEGRRLYFGRKRNVQRKYSVLIHEQDPASAHRYVTDDFDMPDGAILFDIGAADGNFSLSMVERASKVYIFETDKSWIAILAKTFEPWKDKVEIINKFVSDSDSRHTVMLDTITSQLQDGSTLFLKVDVEGAESKVLEGAKQTLSSGRFNVRAVICTYHQYEDYEYLSGILQDKGYVTQPSRGYMLFRHGHFAPPYFRHGLIRCSKEAAVK